MRQLFVPVFYFINVNPAVNVSKPALFFTATQRADGVVGQLLCHKMAESLTNFNPFKKINYVYEQSFTELKL